jgi:hypothetical protein
MKVLRGFPELMKQSHTEAVISYLNDDVVKQYEGANKVYFIFFENQESVLAPGKKFTQNLMRIDAKSFETDDKKWEEVKEFLLAGLKTRSIILTAPLVPACSTPQRLS